MKKLFEHLKEDLWVLVMDIIAVNAAYLLTFFLRYYVHLKFVPAAMHFVSDYLKFAPFYTVLCLVVFAAFGLYKGMWRYASVNDMNRIILANLAATLLLVLGTWAFTERLPVSIYAIGACFQLLFTIIIRFAYGIVEMEKRKLGGKKQEPRKVLLIGTDTNAANIARYLSDDSLYKPVAAVGNGTNMRGLPVVSEVEDGLSQYKIDCVVVADPVYSDRKRETLRQLCESRGIELHDYSGFLKNQSGSLPLTELTKVISGGARIKYGDKVYDSLEQALQALSGRYNVAEITGKDLTIEIEEAANSMAKWAQDYAKETGEDLSFF